MMTINKISKYSTTLLAALVFVSSLSCTVDFHYCQGQLKSFSFVGKAKNCHEMPSKMASCSHYKSNKTEDTSCSEDKNCCNNNSINFESDLDDQILIIDYIDAKFQSVVKPVSILILTNLRCENENENHFAHYKPPLIQRDISVLFESLLL